MGNVWAKCSSMHLYPSWTTDVFHTHLREPKRLKDLPRTDPRWYGGRSWKIRRLFSKSSKPRSILPKSASSREVRHRANSSTMQLKVWRKAISLTSKSTLNQKHVPSVSNVCSEPLDELVPALPLATASRIGLSPGSLPTLKSPALDATKRSVGSTETTCSATTELPKQTRKKKIRIYGTAGSATTCLFVLC